MLGDMISELRKDKGVLQKELAELLGVSIGTISNYETNVHNPELESLIKLADYFGVSIDYMLGRIKFSPDLNTLNTVIMTHENKSITVGEMINEIILLKPDSQKALIAQLELLQLKDRQK